MSQTVVEMTGDESRLLRSLQRVIAKEAEHERQLSDVGNAGARVGDKIKSGADKGTSAFKSFGKSVAGQISILAGFQSGIQAVNGYLQDQVELLDNAAERQVSVAKAQQQAAKNLAGLAAVERSDLLKDTVAEITLGGFSDPIAITTALGAVASTGVSDPATIANAVKQASRIETLTPEDLPTTASVAARIQSQTGLPDIRQAISLIETSGSQALIGEFPKLVDSLPRAVGALTATVKEQDPVEAARQAAALFSVVTQSGGDTEGKRSTTFAADFGNRLREFFVGLEDEQINARSKIELLDRKIAKGSDTEANRRDRERLQEFLDASKGLVDPKTLFGRIEAIQSDPALGRQLVGAGFGEKQFQVALKDLTEGTAEVKDALNNSFKTIQASAAFFEREVEELNSGTPQRRVANIQQRSLANIAAQEFTDTEGASLSLVRELVAKSLAATRSDEVLKGTSQYLGEVGISSGDILPGGILPGSTAASEAFGGLGRLILRRNQLELDGITSREKLKIDRLESDISAITDLLASGSIASSRDDLERILELAERGSSHRGFAGQVMRELIEAIQESNNKVIDAINEGNASNKITAENTTPRPSRGLPVPER